MVSAAAQRWRLTFGRAADAPPVTHQALAADWLERLAGSGLPFPGTEPGLPGRPRLVFAAPLPLGMTADRELVDLELAERLPVATVRAAIEGSLPVGIRLIELHDVWLGESSLAGLARRAEYVVVLAPDVAAADVEAATERLLASTEIVRQRDKGGRAVDYDLRPLVIDVHVEEPGPPMTLLVITAFDPERGVGRPEEVLAALGEVMGSAVAPPTATAIRRRRVVLAGES